MTESEAITELRRRAYRTTCYGNKVLEHEENLIAIEALEKQIAKPPELCGEYRCCPNCGIVRRSFERYCSLCGQKIRLE
jgi:hypothetical protein|nr:MAG TPA: PROTEIN/RNA Complex, archaeal, ribosomal, 50S, protein.0A [Caudoviricetes sp.]